MPGKAQKNPGRAGAQQKPLNSTRPIGNGKESPSSRFLNLHGERAVPDESARAAGQSHRHRPGDGNQQAAAVPQDLSAQGSDGDHEETLSRCG